MKFTSVNPATGQPISDYELMEAPVVRKIIFASHRAFTSWRGTTFVERATLLRTAARLLRERAPEFACLMAAEMGKPLKAGRAEIEKCAMVCEYYADHAEAMLAHESLVSDGGKCFAAFEPLGVVLAIMPWNFPFWQVFRFAAPALMAGNVGLLKHATNVSGCAMAIEEIFQQAGFPADAFRTLLITNQATKAVIRNVHVRAVTLTGSTAAGQSVASTAGKALKKTVLELGGSDPYIILADADLELAAAACATSRLINSGQSCIAAKRFVVLESVRKEFERLFIAHMSAARMGDPCDEENTMGPLARIDLRDELHGQVEASIATGARCLLGGKVPSGPGAYYPATVLTDVKKGMVAYREELFGPVAAIIPVQSEREAIRVANDSIFGLGAAVFTRDLAKGEFLATTQLEAGCCFVNDFVKSDPRLPFGGIKTSGYGRELSHYGIKEFVNIKTVCVN